MSVEAIGVIVSGNTTLTSVAPNATANTKGSYVQLTASSTIAATGILVMCAGSAPTGADYLVDIATGGSGSESPIISNLQCGRQNSVFRIQNHYIPIKIPSGTRISARTQCSGASGSAFVAAYLLHEETTFSNMSSLATYGANTADSGGTSIDPGGSANTKGGWTQITASTTDDIAWLILGIGNQNNAEADSASWALDIGTGGAGSETVIAANLLVRLDEINGFFNISSLPPLPLAIPSGTRIAVRAQCSKTDATDRLIDVSIIGANGSAITGGREHFSASFMG